MHRSGTSALTRTLSLLGAQLPRNLLSANHGNLAGHWESEKLIALDDELLREAGGRMWDTTRSLGEGEVRGLKEGNGTSKIARALKEEFWREDGGEEEENELFVVKEPRIVRLLDGYIDALQSLDVDTRVVIPVRRPNEVAESLSKRNWWINHEYGLLLWMGYILDAEQKTRDFPRVFVSYDQLLLDWRSLASHIASTLDIAWPNSFDAIAEEVDTFITPDLRHNVVVVNSDNTEMEGEGNGNRTEPELVMWTKKLYEGAVRATEGNQTMLRRVADEARPWFDRMAMLADSYHDVVPLRPK
ncbi:hypothetical protein MNV49_001950 [Pseudohyphozyma bogoriensis]|nr:hypothetical protein MNV49_001950 [Pseudohyphozyma bogoriensis]